MYFLVLILSILFFLLISHYVSFHIKCYTNTLYSIFNFKKLKKNEFLKSALTSSEMFRLSMFEYSDINYIHSLLERIKLWDTNISHFVKFNISIPFNSLNKNRLKNIFFKVINDSLIWDEICKIMDYNLIDFSNYKFSYFHNLLFYFFFNVYLSEFDYYIYNLCFYFNSRYFLYRDYFYSKVHSFPTSSLCFPLKLHFRSARFEDNISSIKIPYFFNKTIFYVRYMGYFLFGTIGSSRFFSKFRLRILGYLKGNLVLNAKDLSVFFSPFTSISFCGYDILLIKFDSYKFTNSSYKQSILKSRLFTRLNAFNLNASKSFLTRIYHDFLFQIQPLLNDFFSNFTLALYKEVWLRLFSCSAVKCFYLFNSPFRRDVGLYCESPYFDLFLFKIKKIILGFSVDASVYRSFLPFDLAFNVILDEFKSNTSFLYFTLFDLLEVRNVFLRSYFLYKLSKISGFLFDNFDLFNLINYYLNLQFEYLNFSSFRFTLPLNRILTRFKELGFCHPVLGRPIGNVGFFKFEDFDILSNFVYFSFLFSLWYYKVYDLQKIRLILNILRKSCFLTLSRKHNKSRSWSRNIYMSEFFKLYNLFNLDHFYFNEASSFGLNNCYFNKGFFLEL